MSSPAPAGQGTAGRPSGGAPRGRGWPLRLLLGLAVVVQVVVLYSPEGGGPPLFPGSDKVVHVLVFLVPVALALLAGLPRWPVVTGFAVQAVVSEVVQGAVLPHRSGDSWDVVADLTGVALGVLVAHLVRRARARTGSDRAAA